MTILDLLIAIPLGWFMFRGWRRGIIRTAATLAGAVAGIWAAVHLSRLVASLLGLTSDTAILIAFFVCFVGAMVLTYLLGHGIERIAKTAHLSLANKIAGTLAGMATALCIVAVILNGSDRAPVFAMVLKAIFLVGAMGGFMIHTYLNLCPTIYKIIKRESGLELADRVICATFKQISVPFFTCYTMLVIISSGMVIYAICAVLLQVPVYCILFNPVVFQAIGLLLRATKLKCFIDAPSCCAASLGLASFGVIALLAV